MKQFRSVLMITALCTTLQAFADTQVNVVGLFSNKALLMINGSGPHSMRAGQTKNGVKLVSANSNAATLVIEGKRQVLKMGQAASVGGSSSASGGGVNSPVSLYADRAGHFYGKLTINGASLKYVVDTGATTVAMNSGDAKYAKIDYTKGQKVRMSTANGVIPAYNVKLNTLKIGTIVLNNVTATIIEGGSPPVVLLGMSAQNRLDVRRENSIMTLTKKY
ncbi:MAG: TIGR02281 family clan AA aspartic protease [Methylophilaceae bacterium]